MAVKSKSFQAYWSKRFEKRLHKYPYDHSEALSYSNKRCMGQIHGYILEEIDVKTKSKILDAGCGLGDLTAKIYSETRKRNFSIYHIDISSELIKESKKYLASELGKLIESCHFLQMDSQYIGFKDNSFDITLSVEALQYVDPYKTLSQLIRVTKRGGRVIVCFPNKCNPIIKKAEKRNKKRYEGIDIDYFLYCCKQKKQIRDVNVTALLLKNDKSEYSYRAVRYNETLFPDISAKSDINRYLVKILL